MNEPKEWYSIREVAERFGCSQATARKMLAAEGIPVLRVGSHLRVAGQYVDVLWDNRFGPLDES